VLKLNGFDDDIVVEYMIVADAIVPTPVYAQYGTYVQPPYVNGEAPDPAYKVWRLNDPAVESVLDVQTAATVGERLGEGVGVRVGVDIRVGDGSEEAWPAQSLGKIPRNGPLQYAVAAEYAN
jgi:hypothetical protein